MRLDLVLLGMLGRPASGYELGQELAGRGQAWWPASLSQIYPTLARLEERGWVVSGPHPSRRGPPRRLYGRTLEGTAALTTALAAAPRAEPQRLPWLAAVRHLGETADPALARDHLAGLHTRLAASLTELDAHLAELPPAGQPAPDLDRHFLRATLRAARATAAARLIWCEQTLAELEEAPWPEESGSEGGRKET